MSWEVELRVRLSVSGIGWELNAKYSLLKAAPFHSDILNFAKQVSITFLMSWMGKLRHKALEFLPLWCTQESISRTSSLHIALLGCYWLVVGGLDFVSSARKGIDGNGKAWDNYWLLFYGTECVVTFLCSQTNKWSCKGNGSFENSPNNDSPTELRSELVSVAICGGTSSSWVSQRCFWGRFAAAIAPLSRNWLRIIVRAELWKCVALVVFGLVLCSFIPVLFNVFPLA